MTAPPLAQATGRAPGIAALATAAAGFGYAVAFVLLRDAGAASLLLLAGGLTAVPALLGIAAQVRPAEPGLTQCALAFALAGTLGSAVHGGYDLANALHPPAVDVSGLPNPVDPRGLLAFGATGLGLLLLGRLLGRTHALGTAAPPAAFVAGTLLVLLYLARLVVLDPASPLVLVPAAITGFVAGPLMWVLLGLALLRRA